MNIAASEVVMGAALVTLFIAGNVPLGFLTIVMAQVMFSIPFVAITVRARLVGFDRSLEESAQDLGASPFRPSSWSPSRSSFRVSWQQHCSHLRSAWMTT